MYSRVSYRSIILKFKVSKTYKIVVVIAIIAVVITVFAHILHGANFPALNPKGQVAEREKSLIIFTVILSLVVVVPVFSLLAFILIRYREGNTESKYSPDWDNSRFFEGLWWGVPCLIIIVLAVVTWTSTHQLDPYRAIDSKNKPINVQVVALQWKWLFIYPDLGIASVNELEFPVNTPINFELTADAPMNSFWIPSLGGQIYAMPGMVTQLHLIADTTGNYAGSSANISGDGFAGMKFTAKARTASQYQSWLSSVRASSLSLTDPMYSQIAKPSSYVKPATYVLGSSTLYDKIVAKYMMPSGSTSGSDSMNMTEQN